MLHNNLGVGLVAFEGPQAALAELRIGIAYATARGLNEIADITIGSTLSALFDVGQLDDALALAKTLADHTQDDQIALSEVRSVQARVHTLRGQPALAADYMDWLVTTARDAGAAESLAHCLGAAAITHTALGNPAHATTIVTELAGAPGTRDNSYYAALLPALVRTALTIGHPDIAETLTAGYRPHTPYAHHALITATAALAEARGDHQAAADGYADAATRWEQFGVIPEHAYALQGHGRCLINLGQPHEAAPILHQARALFDQLGATPALAETDALLEQATALSS
jgi:tetratricopeptide (TPR) repeat protein